MKKLMIAAAIVCAAVVSQAATVNWKTGGTIKPDGENTAQSGTLNLYVWVVDSNTYSKTALEDIWKTYGNTKISEISGFTTSVTGKGGTMSSSAAQTVSVAPAGTTDTYYGLIIGTWDSDKDGTVDMYTVNKNIATMNDGGTAGGGIDSLKKFEGTGTAVTWQTAAVPEPTSAMLLLLGMAGLALRRRRA